MDDDLVVIFLFVLVLVGMLQWFRLQRVKGSGLGPADQQALERALDHARRLEERVESLERVLDEDMPGWRRKVSA
jgi:phage shock protein B